MSDSISDDSSDELNRPRTPREGSRFGKKDFNIQSKQIIANVYNFFQNLAKTPQIVNEIDFKQVQKLTGEACGVSRSTVQKVKREIDKNEDVEFESPRKKFKKLSKITNLDNFDNDVIRKSICYFYERGEYPTVEKIRQDLVKKIGFKGSKTSLRRILRHLGFRFKKCNDGRQYLLERSDIAATRAVFLRKMHAIRNCPCPQPIFYLDETWVNQNHSKKMAWVESSGRGGLKVPVGKGGRLIVVHVGSANTGFVPECKLIFRSKKANLNSDYHTEMNSSLFREWFYEMLCLLEAGSIIVMDNASYHSALAEKVPRSNWKKGDIQDWLKGKNVHFEEHETRAELLNKSEIKNAPRIYELDQMANEMGHEVIRLPPYHAQYNPIELIWAQVKGKVADRNTTFRMCDVETLMNEAVNQVTVDDWAKCVRHAERLQEEDYKKQCQFEVAIEPLIINLADDEDSDNSANESSFRLRCTESSS